MISIFSAQVAAVPPARPGGLLLPEVWAAELEARAVAVGEEELLLPVAGLHFGHDAKAQFKDAAAVDGLVERLRSGAEVPAAKEWKQNINSANSEISRMTLFNCFYLFPPSLSLILQKFNFAKFR